MAIRIAFSLVLVAVFSIMIISAAQQPAFADRTIYFDKVLDINKDSLEQVMGFTDWREAGRVDQIRIIVFLGS